MKKVKILFFTTTLGGGGAEMHFLRVFNALSPQIFEKKMVLARPGGNYEQFIEANNAPIHLCKEHKSSSTKALISSFAPLMQLINTWQPALVFTVLNMPAAIAILASNRAKVKPKVVCSIQNTLSTRFNKGIEHRVQLWLLKRLLPKAAGVIALSKGVAADIEATVDGLVPMQIYNAGYDSTLVQRLSQKTAIPLTKAKFIGVSVGRLTKQKGYPILLEALAKLPNQAWEHWILGTGPDLTALKQQCIDLGIAEKVHFLGFQSNPFPFMKAANCLILPSLWEGFGNVIVESMACGTPVIAADCFHGPSEIIEHRQNGLLVPVNNSQILSENIALLMEDTSLLNQMANNAPKRASFFHADAIAATHANYFLNLINK